MRFNKRFGIIKPSVDAHTLGIIAISQILEQCGIDVIIGDRNLCDAIYKISSDSYFKLIEDWITHNKLSYLGFSYRLDPKEGVDLFSRLVYRIDKSKILQEKASELINNLFFAGLQEACILVEKRFHGRVQTFIGDENIHEILCKLNIPQHKIPSSYRTHSDYDHARLRFGESILAKELHMNTDYANEYHYPSYGLKHDTLVERLTYARKTNQLPLIRCHTGPYIKPRENALALFSEWLKILSKSNLLDIVSIGSSQLSQSNFGEVWGDKPNGGGVPFNSEFELRSIYHDALPMLTRAYSATNNIKINAEILEKNLNMAWHALSLWWFNKLDGRGPLGLKQNLTQHIETIKYIAKTNKPFEPNVPHHFAFRGSDDISYIASTYIAAKLAKKIGIKTLVLQNMLNTPKFTTGLGDIVRSRVLLRILRTLADKNFSIIFQPRAGLNYFSPDTEKAKSQLAAVTALMSDIEPKDEHSPEIIHVVSYTEAVKLADPEVIHESIRITKASLKYYPEFKQKNDIPSMIDNKLLSDRIETVSHDAWLLIENIEATIEDPYSAQGLYDMFFMGYFPVPYLWGCREDFPNAVNWRTGLVNGNTFILDDFGKKMSIEKRVEMIKESKAGEYDRI